MQKALLTACCQPRGYSEISNIKLHIKAQIKLGSNLILKNTLFGRNKIEMETKEQAVLELTSALNTRVGGNTCGIAGTEDMGKVSQEGNKSGALFDDCEENNN